MFCFAVGDELVTNVLRQVRGDRESESDGPGTSGHSLRHCCNRRGDSDDLALGVEQWPTGVTGVNGGVNLDGVGDDEGSVFCLGCRYGPVERRNDPGGCGLRQAKGVSNGDD